MASCRRLILMGSREHDLQRQVSLAKQQLRDLRTSNESNQAKLFDHSQRQSSSSGSCSLVTLTTRVDQEVVDKLAEVDMIAADLERANSRVATVERQNVREIRWVPSNPTCCIGNASHQDGGHAQW